MSASSVPVYLPGDTLRFYPQGLSNHYTAIVLADGTLLSVPSRKPYPTLSHWGMTLPEWDSSEVLVNHRRGDPEPALREERKVPSAPLKQKRKYDARYAYPAKTLLRYYFDDSDNHVTALVVADTYILQLKPVKKSFASVDDWLDSISEEGIWEEDLTVQMPNSVEYPHTKCKIPLYKGKVSDNEEITLSESFDGMRIEITGPSDKVRRSLDLIFQSMKI
uniref:Uncharacterized protein n=1 Tax=viral metagenome TaxID=1070528 RepID=A0A6C0KU60_9ZZZZ